MSNIYISSPQTSVYLVDTSNTSKTFLLPSVSTVPGLFLSFKDYFGTSSNSTITLSTTGVDTIENVVNYYTFSNTYGSISILNDGIKNWSILDFPTSRSFIPFLGPITRLGLEIPEQIAGLQLWLDANDPNANGGTLSNNTIITTWFDKSGCNNNVTGFNSPRWYSSPSRMSNASSAYFSGSNPTSYNMIAFFVYYDNNSPDGCAPIYTANDPAITDVTGIFPNCGGTTYVQTSGGWATQGATITDVTSNIVSLQYSSATNTNNVQVYFNGTLNFTTSSSPFTRSSFTLGRRGGNYMTGNFYECLFYNVILSTTDRQRIEGYLAWKWGLQGNLPAGHPYKSSAPSNVTSSNTENTNVDSSPFTTTVTFSYTGANQTFTVPAGIVQIGVYMWGAGGGRGAAGAMVQGILSVTSGETLNILVGEGGQANATNSYGGGGKGGIQNGSGQLGGSGGGRSAIQRGGTAPTNDIVVAGGGGGANPYFGSLGGAATFSGTANDGTSKTNVQGRGGTQSAGGAGGGTGQYGTGLAGSRGLGGDTVDGGYNGGGGGGGGYYGGGAGGTNGGDGAGGGGGSSFIDNLSLLGTVFGFNSPDGITAPSTTSPYYVSGVGQGGGNSGSATAGGNGLVVIRY